MAIVATRTHLGSQFSEGARLLWVAMESRGWSQGQLTKAVAARPGVVPRWLYGDTKPSWDWAKKISGLFGIALEAWTLEPTAPFVPPAAREEPSPKLPSSGTDG